MLKPFHLDTETGTTEDQITTMLSMLEKSAKPILLLGDGATRTESDEQLRVFLEKTSLYAAYTFMGKGSIDHRYARSLHCVGLGMKDIAVEVFDETDLVMCVGYDMAEWPPTRWNTTGETKIIHINSTCAEVDQHHTPDIEMIGSIPIILEVINAGGKLCTAPVEKVL